MTMIEHNFVQGSPEWHQHRATHYNASDAPAMLGMSKYKTRPELMHEMHTGFTPEVDPATQARFDAGHRFEALARPLAEQIIGEELFPVVVSAGKLSASLDGITMLGDAIWEHKTLNATLRDFFADADTMHPNVRASAEVGKLLPITYQAQMEQQLMISDAQRCLFMASRWSGDGELLEERHCWYESDPDLRRQIVAGWQQFEHDLAQYQPSAAPDVVERDRKPDNLPALMIEVSGRVVSSNLKPFRQHALAVIDDISTDLQTDQDFADAEAAVKWLRDDVAAQLKAAKQHAMAQASDIDALFRIVDSVISAADSKRLQLEKLVKQRKDEIRGELIGSAQVALDEHVAGLNKRMPQPWLNRIMGGFIDVIRGKRSLTSMQDAIDAELARCKIEANELAGRLQDNAAALRDDEGRDWMFLFADFKVAGLKPTEDFRAIAAQRIQLHKDAEAKRRQAEEDAAAAAEQAALFAAAKPEPAPEPAPPAPAPAPAPAAVRKTVRSDDDGQRLKLGEISALLGLAVTAEFLATLGFNPVATDRSAKMYRTSDFPAICDAIADLAVSARIAFEQAQQRKEAA
ncbi:YqaJ viral recombinase family protein [Brachymonas wangyanguii]|uniref:YqaJ viral recombinase family protein n=1 Tax=Brachymonas wangyanguii TaxID=3130163 RepID=UPI00307E45FE